MPRNMWNDIVSWQTRRLNNSAKYLTPCIDDHHFQRRKNGICWRIVTSMLSKLFWNAYTWHGLEDLIFYGQWNLHGRLKNGPKPVTNAWIDWYLTIHHTCEYKQYCYVGNTAKQCRLGLFQDSDFAGDLEDSKSTSGGTLCVFGSHTCVPISWMCKKTNFSFAQFNRIRNHLFGRWVEIGRNSRSRFMGSDCFSPWENTIQTHDRMEQPVVNCDKDHGPSKLSQGMLNVLK